MIRFIICNVLFAIVVWNGFKIEISIGEYKISFGLYGLKRFFHKLVK